MALGGNFSIINRVVIMLPLRIAIGRMTSVVTGQSNEWKSCNVPAGELHLMHVALNKHTITLSKPDGTPAGETARSFF